MRASLSKNEENMYDGLLVSPDTLFDEDWILSKIGNIGTTHTVELVVMESCGRASIEIKIPALAKKDPPPMETKLSKAAT